MSQGVGRKPVSGGRSLPLLGLMVLVWLTASTAIMSGFPLRFSSLPHQPAHPETLFHVYLPVESIISPHLVFATVADLGMDGRQILTRSRPLLVSGGEDLWLLAHESPSDQLEIESASSDIYGRIHVGPSAVVVNVPGETSIHIRDPGLLHTGTWLLPRGTTLALTTSGTGGVWVSAWKPGAFPEFPSSWPEADQRGISRQAMVTEHLVFLSLDGETQASWVWDDEIILQVAHDREAAYSLSWTTTSPVSTMIRRLPASGSGGWSISIEEFQGLILRSPVAGDPVDRLVWGAASAARPGEITAWPGPETILVASAHEVLALDVTGQTLFRRSVSGPVRDVVRSGDYTVVLKETDQGSALLYLDGRGRDAARLWGLPGWDRLLLLPWGHLVAWGGPEMVAYDSHAREMWRWAPGSEIVAVTGGYWDPDGNSGVIAVWTADGRLELLRLDWGAGS